MLASASIGITPVLAIMHGLAVERSSREIWGLHGARNREHHPLALESRTLLRLLPRARSRIWYSEPTAEDRLGRDFNAAGHMTVASFDALNIPRDAGFYLCGPTAFMHAICTDLAVRGVPSTHIDTETFGSGESVRRALSMRIIDPCTRPS